MKTENILSDESPGANPVNKFGVNLLVIFLQARLFSKSACNAENLQNILKNRHHFFYKINELHGTYERFICIIDSVY